MTHFWLSDDSVAQLPLIWKTKWDPPIWGQPTFISPARAFVGEPKCFKLLLILRMNIGKKTSFFLVHISLGEYKNSIYIVIVIVDRISMPERKRIMDLKKQNLVRDGFDVQPKLRPKLASCNLWDRDFWFSALERLKKHV